MQYRQPPAAAPFPGPTMNRGFFRRDMRCLGGPRSRILLMSSDLLSFLSTSRAPAFLAAGEAL